MGFWGWGFDELSGFWGKASFGWGLRVAILSPTLTWDRNGGRSSLVRL